MIDSLERIRQLEQSLAFGTLHITVKRHDSQTVAINGQTLRSHKVEDNPSALTIIIALLKAAEANQETGTICCTIELDKGLATRVVVEENQRTLRALE
jgi:hypothetical protein